MAAAACSEAAFDGCLRDLPCYYQNIPRRAAVEEGGAGGSEGEEGGEGQSWRAKSKKMKTLSIGISLCLNVGVAPPDSVRASPASKMECWLDPSTMPPLKVRLSQLMGFASSGYVHTAGRSIQTSYRLYEVDANPPDPFSLYPLPPAHKHCVSCAQVVSRSSPILPDPPRSSLTLPFNAAAIMSRICCIARPPNHY